MPSTPKPATTSTQTATTKPQAQPARSKGGKFSEPKQATLPLEVPRAVGESAVDPALRYRREIAHDSSGFNLRPWVLGGVAAVIVCVIVIWHFVSAKPAPLKSQPPVQSARLSTATSQPMIQPAGQPIINPAPAAAIPSSSVAPHAPGWYVIAWTYNHQSQAQGRADRINARNRGFHAEVFTPHGGVPYLVSLGGPMSESEAKALQQRARRSGLPHDTYIRNYR
jgi:hypothetical protein